MKKSTRSKSRPTPKPPTPPSLIVGLDVGYGYTKLLAQDQQRVIVPSLVAPADIHSFSLGLSNTSGTVTVDEVEYVVGEAAVSRGFRFAEEYDGWWTSVRYRALIQYLAQFIPPQSHVCAGLPLHIFNAVKAHEQVQDVIRHGLRTQRVTLMPQGVGAYCHAATVDPALKNGRIGIVDIGGRTTELVTICDGTYLAHQSKGLLVGVNTVFQAAAKQLATQTERPIDAYEFDWGYRGSKPIVIQGTPVPRETLAGVVEPLFGPFLEHLFREMTTVWGAGAPSLDRLMFCGGGATIFGERLSAFRAHSAILPDSQFANAAGYLAYALMASPVHPTAPETLGHPAEPLADPVEAGA